MSTNIKILYSTIETNVTDLMDTWNAGAQAPSSTQPFNLTTVYKHTTEDKWWFICEQTVLRNGQDVVVCMKDDGGNIKAQIGTDMDDAIAAGDLIELEFADTQALIDGGWLPEPEE